MECYCKQLATFSVIFNGKYGELKGEHRGDLTFCCEHFDGIPGISLCDTAEETVAKLIRLRNQLVQATQSGNIPAGCLKCPHFQATNRMVSDTIRFISLSMYPSPCQCKCCYCGLHGTKLTRLNKSLYEGYYKKVFEVVRLLMKEGLIAPDARWQVACGEISIHPFKDEILELVADKRVNILTNAFVFDKNIAKILQANPYASINLSIDAGTAKAWKQVKGVDNFSAILSNLQSYRAVSNPNQIELKYILLPGVNTSLKDFMGIIRIMRGLGITNLIVSHDFAISHSNKKLQMYKAILLMLLKANGFTHEDAHF